MIVVSITVVSTSGILLGWILILKLEFHFYCTHVCVTKLKLVVAGLFINLFCAGFANAGAVGNVWKPG